MSTVTEALLPYWSEFLAATNRSPDTLLYDAFHFCDSEALATELAELVLAGTKTGTATLVWDCEDEGIAIPKAGDLSIVLSWDRQPLCVIEDTAVEVTPFNEVGDAFAASEGEGDRTLRYWREAHSDFFGRACKRLGRDFEETAPIVCENFKVVHFFVDRP